MYDVEEFGKMAAKIIEKSDAGYSFVVAYGPSGSGKSSAIDIARKEIPEITESYCLYGCQDAETAMSKILGMLRVKTCLFDVFSTSNRKLADRLAVLHVPVVYLSDK